MAHFINCYTISPKLSICICCLTSKCGADLILSTMSSFKRPKIIPPAGFVQKRHYAMWNYLPAIRFLSVTVWQPNANRQLKLLASKEGVDYWRSDQKLPTMGSKAVDREPKKLAKDQPAVDQKAKVNRRSERRVDGHVDWSSTICCPIAHLAIVKLWRTDTPGHQIKTCWR